MVLMQVVTMMGKYDIRVKTALDRFEELFDVLSSIRKEAFTEVFQYYLGF